MSRFNQAATIPLVQNLAGGNAYAVDERTELIGLIWTSFCADSFYSKWSASLGRLRTLVAKHPELASKAALVARRRFGLRSISHVVAALVAHEARGQSWLRPFLYNIVKRPDDMLEILAVRSALGLPKAVPHSMRRAFADRLTEQSAYSLAKYRGDDKTFSLRDAVFLCHPKPTEAIQSLVAGTLKNTETWEAMGNSAETWTTLLNENKLGYLALLRNLRNIAQIGDASLIRLAAKALVDPTAIQKSLTMPHQYVRALNALCENKLSLIPKVLLEALSEATELSLSNLPQWPGTTIIALDGSGSMRPAYDLQQGRKPGRDPWTTARCFAAALWKRCENPIFIPFTTVAEIVPLPVAPTLTLQELIDRKVASGGTATDSVFDLLNRRSIPADRVILLTDEQSWAGSSTAFQAFERWRQGTHCNPIVHSVDLESYGTCQFPTNRLNLVFGWNNHLFDILKALEEGTSRSLVDYLEGLVPE
jgi:60 kDa SS-A/Ro ribonucleoprotein